MLSDDHVRTESNFSVLDSTKVENNATYKGDIILDPDEKEDNHAST